MKNLAIVTILCGLVVAGFWAIFSPQSREVVMPLLKFNTNDSSSQTAAAAYIVPAYSGEEYRNDHYRFSLALPDGFRAQELPVDENGGQAIVLQDERGNGIQIYIVKDEANNTFLSADDVRASIPDMKVTNEQEVEIGPDNRGVAFMSDSAEFGGASREVWFYFGGNLYQISTYARLDALLQSMFSTWRFF